MTGTPARRILVVGAGGMLGSDLATALADRDATLATRAQLDVTDAESVLAAAEGHDVLVNAAAYTAVDDAETHEDAAHLINAVGAGILARAAATHGARLIQVSTDYVFDGKATTAYAENHPLNPLSAYGRTKADGERLALRLNPSRTSIVRTAWLYGEHGKNFARTMLRLATEGDTVDVVNDQFGQPTWSADVAAQIVALIDSDAPDGSYHATNSGRASWFDFAQAVFALGGHDPARVRPTHSAANVRPAPRPAFSVLGHDAWAAAGLTPMRDWRAALSAAFAAGALDPR